MQRWWLPYLPGRTQSGNKQVLLALVAQFQQPTPCPALTDLVALVKRAVRAQAQQLAELLDASAGPWPAALAAGFASLALRCVEYERSDRPDLRSEVVPELQRLHARAQEQAAASQLAAAVAGASLSSAAGGPQEPPRHLLCPITQELMTDPVVGADGHTYERSAMEGWLNGPDARGRSPLTNLRLEHTQLVPNYAIKAALEEWQERHHLVIAAVT